MSRRSRRTRYSALGYLIGTRQRQKGIAERAGDSLHYKSQDTVVVDGLGNLQARVSGDTTRVWIGTSLQGPRITYNYRTELYRAHVGRDTLNNSSTGGPQRILYDSAGNVEVTSKTAGSLDAIHEDRLSYYDASGRLVASLLRQDDFSGSRRSVIEDYRYDALGRRVWVRAQRNVPAHTNPAIEYFVSFTRRTVWDGEQELAEIQMPGDPAHSAHFENDTATVPILPKYSGLYDPNPFYGRVIYAYGNGLDKPLSVTRYKYRDAEGGGVWPTYGMIPFWNVLGQAAGGAFDNGQAYLQKSSGGTHCRTVPLSQRCLYWDWPGARTAYNARSGYGASSFNGTLLEDKQDAAGTFFRRNRVYDPATGRFTQEDPIGLAGGLNLYGFANGDPVNVSDPFGLMACPPYCDPFQQLAAWAPAMKSMLGGFAVGTAAVGAGAAAMAGGGAGAGATGIAQSAALGRAGEAAAGIIKNTVRIASATGTAAYRIPDALNSTTLTEVKNVARLSLTNQIRDLAAFANSTGRSFELVVRQSTEFTRPLADFIKNNGIQVRFLP